jgi:hypothetical protein
MASHEDASDTSRSLCDSIFDNLKLAIPDLDRSQGGRLCSFRQRGGNQFAHVYHRSRLTSIEIYCLGSYQELLAASGAANLPIAWRGEGAKVGSWAERFPGHFKLEDLDDAAAAALLLASVSFSSPQAAKASGRTLPSGATMLPEKVAPAGDYIEGAITPITINSYERSPKARSKCLSIHGFRCIVCGFDFEATYGKQGKGIIHVHHLKELSSIGRGYKVNPETDLVPICPNCHAVVHSRRDPAYTVEEMRAMLKGEC